jgi:hypothetical protein
MSARRNRARSPGNGAFFKFERRIYHSADFLSLTAQERAVYLALAMQFNGHNNGDLCAAPAVMAKHGLAHSTVRRAIKTLLARNLIALTRQGCKRRCSLYALTHEPVDECGGKLDYRPRQRKEFSKTAVTGLSQGNVFQLKVAARN